MKKIIFAAAISCLFLLPSCGGALKSLTGKQLDNKEDIEYALKLIREKAEKKKVPEASIDGTGRELKNSIQYVMIYDMADNNEVSVEMIGISPETSSIHTYEPSSYHSSEVNASRRDPAATPGLDPAILNADLLMQVLEKAKTILKEEFSDYTFKVVGGYSFEVDGWNYKRGGKTIGTLTLNVTKSSDSQYTSGYYYEVKFKFDTEGNITSVD